MHFIKRFFLFSLSHFQMYVVGLYFKSDNSFAEQCFAVICLDCLIRRESKALFSLSPWELKLYSYRLSEFSKVKGK